MRIFATMISADTQQMIPKIQDYFKNKPVDKAWLFGSRSRGEEREDSDVDILVTFAADAKISLLKYAGYICDLEELLNKKVDVVQDGSLKPFAVESVNHDKFLIYERTS